MSPPKLYCEKWFNAARLAAKSFTVAQNNPVPRGTAMISRRAPVVNIFNARP
jgi:hypothetical protein